MKNDKFDGSEIERIRRGMSKQANYKTSTGYTGNKSSVSQRKKNKKQKKQYSKKQRQTEGLSRRQNSNLWRLQNQVNEMFEKNSKVSRKEEGKETKKDFKTGLKVEGIWGSNAYIQYFKKFKTFLKYCVENYDIESLGSIKRGMLVSYIEDHIKRNNSPKTIGGYMTAIKKVAEFAEKENIKSLASLVSARAVELCPEYNSEEYRRGSLGGYDIKDVRVLAKKADESFGKFHRAAIEVLGFSGPRLEEFLTIKWKHLDFEKNLIYLTDPNMTKGARNRFVPVPEKTMQLLKGIYDLNLHTSDDERIWGSRMSRNSTRDFIKECARLGKTKYSGVHDFRRSTVLYHKRATDKAVKQGKLDKEKIVDRILDHVSIPGLNPLVDWKRPKVDRNGKPVYKTTKSGQRIRTMETVKDKDGNPIKVEKYRKADLMEKRMDYIKNLYLSQILGHNRTSITSVYLPPKLKKKKVKTEENDKK